MSKIKFSKSQHFATINMIMSLMIIYANVLHTHQVWTALIITTASLIMIANPNDFVTGENDDGVVGG